MVKEKNEVKEKATTKVKKQPDKKVKKEVKKVKEKKQKDTTTFRSELSKVKWPTKKQMIKYSVATIVFVIFFAIFFYAIELVMAFLKSMI